MSERWAVIYRSPTGVVSREQDTYPSKVEALEQLVFMMDALWDLDRRWEGGVEKVTVQ